MAGIYRKSNIYGLGDAKSIYKEGRKNETLQEIGGRMYRCVEIGGKIWMAENLDFKTLDIDIGPSGSPESPAAWYYDNDEATYGENGNRYGLLYNWFAVKYLEDNKTELFPGWHVPTNSEWTSLSNAAGGYRVSGGRLKSTTGWSSGAGDGSYGFEGFPAGRMYSGSFSGLGSQANFWTAIERSSTEAPYRFFNTGALMNEYYINKKCGFSVRLVKD